MDTIFALATAPGKAGVAVIRISGPQAHAGAETLCTLPQPRRAALRALRARDGSLLDTGLVLVFDADASFTGEPVVELQLHGSVAVVAAVLECLSKITGFRPAGPGEFTRRALDNDRLDLAQVEGLADLIDAETELQRKQAQASFGGQLAVSVTEWRRDLIEAGALLEATLDFSDEDIPDSVALESMKRIKRVRSALTSQIFDFDKAERLRDGFQVAIMGPPNAGKSTLLNKIAQRPAALTSHVAGTTRDVIEVRMDLAGLPVTFLDTAGLRETDDPLEAAGIALARDRARDADLRVWISVDAQTAPDDADLSYKAKDDTGVFGGISGETGAGVKGLLDDVVSKLMDMVPTNQVATRARHRDAMVRANERLQLVVRGLESGYVDELIAENLRLSAQSLSELIGVVDVEDLLDHIFSSFCIGK